MKKTWAFFQPTRDPQQGMIGNRDNGVGNFISNLFKGIGIFLGVVLLALGGWIGVENLQAPGMINIPIMVFSVAAILVGALFLWLALRKNEQGHGFK